MTNILCVFLRDTNANSNMALHCSAHISHLQAVVLSLEAANATLRRREGNNMRGQLCLTTGFCCVAYAVIGEVMVGAVYDNACCSTYALAAVHEVVSAITLHIVKDGMVTAAAVRKDLGRLCLLLEEIAFQGPVSSGPQITTPLGAIFAKKVTEASAGLHDNDSASTSRAWLQHEAAAHIEHLNTEMLCNNEGLFVFNNDDDFETPPILAESTTISRVDFLIPHVTPLEPDLVVVPLATQLAESIISWGHDAFTVTGELQLQSRTVFLQHGDETTRTISFHIDLSAPEVAKSIDVSVHPACGHTVRSSLRSHVIKITVHVALEGGATREGPKILTLLRYKMKIDGPLPLPVLKIATQATPEMDVYQLRWALNPEIALKELLFKVYPTPREPMEPPFTSYDPASHCGVWTMAKKGLPLPQSMKLLTLETLGPCPTVAFELEGKTEHPHSGVALSFMPSHLGSQSAVLMFQGGHIHKVTYSGKI